MSTILAGENYSPDRLVERILHADHKNRKDIERVQKATVRVIMGKDFTTYKNGLRKLKLETLEKRKEILGIKTDQVKGLFQLHHSTYKI